ncbi:hypothetical protein D9611_003760 [Ephemerocybe angulata]|uniref:Sld7 C-terminal domain-containing protein n=1 Tax=Ephemerocybe angulata TaxID=980116 RepID=A0A8H5B6A6_9AGAR|nr:hypothetical protein D9611_003760 [Tulosesus angulatus]
MSQPSPSKAPRTPSTSKILPRPGSSHSQTPSQLSTSYRLLYRGALSLPDSHILLDGLAFVAKLESPTKHVTTSLLENSLALALESMRGRPSLRFQGVVKLADVYMDESACVEMDIHPRALISRIYFENMFCLKPFPANPKGKATQSTLKSDIGIKISLGDSDGPETTQIVVYAHLPPPTPLLNSPSKDKDPTHTPNANPNSPTIQLRVARLTPRPTQKPIRLPRPDDPIPRKPPLTFASNASTSMAHVQTLPMQRVGSLKDLKRVASGSLKGDLKRVASGSFSSSSAAGVTNGLAAKRPKLVGGNASSGNGNVGNVGAGVGMLSGLGSGVRLPPVQAHVGDGDVFKVPELPRQVSAKNLKVGGGKEKGKERERDVDVGDVDDVFGGAVLTSSLKDVGDGDDLFGLEDEFDGGAVERGNKNTIKKATIAFLAKVKDPAKKDAVFDKNHPDFKEFYGAVYRGVCFAVRGRIRLETVDQGIVERLLKMHTRMYLTGLGPPAA